jgi:hypothetical protein
MQTILVGFSRPKKFKIGSFLIRLIEGVDFSHVFLMIGTDVYHESVPSVNKLGYLTFLDQHKLVDLHMIYVTEEKHAEIAAFCNDCLINSIPYGKLQIVGMGFLRVVNQLFRTKLKNPFADGMKTMVCSEFVGVVLEKIGLDIPDDQLEIEGPKLIHKMVIKISDETCHEQLIKLTEKGAN